MRNLGCDSVDV